jgi:trimeric autotransporter adhesin
MRGYRFKLVFIVGLVGCGFDRPDDVGYHVGGEVTGMWDGGTVTLRLEATGVDELLTVDANEPFEFETLLDDGTSFTISVDTPPPGHTCDVTGGASAIAGGDHDTARVGCSGPDVDVTLSAPVDWTFDPSALAQTVDLSLLVQEVAITVTAPAATGIRIEGEDVTSETPSTPRTLVPGTNSATVEIEADSVSRTFEITLDRGSRSIEHDSYLKASNTGEADSFGTAVAISGDLLAIAATGEDSASTTINGSQTDNSADGAGAVYVFRRTASTWEQIAYVKPSNTDAGDVFGKSIALEGNVLVVGAPAEDGPTDNLNDSGAAYVFAFDRATGLWTQETILRASDAAGNGRFGTAVTISGDVIAVSSNPDIGGRSAVYVFRRNGPTWQQEDRLLGSEGGPGDGFGFDLSLDGGVLGVGAPGLVGGQAYVFAHNGSDWLEEGILRSDAVDDYFGRTISVSGQIAVVGAMWDPSDGRGINPPTGGVSSMSGAVYVFAEEGGNWSKEAFIKSSNSDQNDSFGFDVAVEGDVMIASAFLESSAASGINGDESDNSMGGASAVYVFHREARTWTQAFYVKASNPDPSDAFSITDLSRDTMVVGGYGEDSDATGVGGSQGNSARSEGSGAAYCVR